MTLNKDIYLPFFGNLTEKSHFQDAFSNCIMWILLFSMAF